MIPMPRAERLIVALDVPTAWPARKASRLSDLQLWSEQPISTLTSFEATDSGGFTLAQNSRTSETEIMLAAG